MKSRVTRNDRRLIFAVFLALIAAAAAGWMAFGQAVLLPFVIVCLIVSLWAQFEGVRRGSEEISLAREEAFNHFRQVESLMSLFATLKPGLPLPSTRDWAASPDFLKEIVTLMLMRKPRVVVEAGSGVSTLIIAYCLEKLGGGIVISLEPEPKIAALTREWIGFHCLGARSRIVHAPLVETMVGGEKFRWYNMSGLELDEPIDLVIVDGPPHNTQALARYPALPLLLPHLAGDARIFLDDALRPDEKIIAERWTREFPEFACQFVGLEKGAYLFARSDASLPPHRAAGELRQNESSAHRGA